jgi:ABC-type oligopeptide transport system substrate-binding subunit
VRRPTRLYLIALAVAVGLLATAALATPAQKMGGTLRLNILFDVDSLDPAIGYQAVTWMLEFATCAKLYSYPDKPAPEGTVTIREVATGLPKVSADGKTQTIWLRRTFRFQTGQAVTAANFVAAFNRDANPKLQSPATSYLHEIIGADAVIQGKAQTISGVKALGPYTIQIRTTRPLPDLVARLTMPFFCPIAVDTPPEEIDDPLGSGPTTSPPTSRIARLFSSATASIGARDRRTSIGS